MKTCPRCGESLSLDRFWRDKRTKSGLSVYCIPCGTKRNADKYRARAAREGRETREWRPLAATLAGGLRKCQRCEEVLPLESFVKNAAKAGGIGSYCKPCHIDINNENKQRLHGGTATYHLRRRYGITAADREEMRAAQGGVCLICTNAPADHVDHDHATGSIRGMLCFNCNGGLGQFKDDPDLVAMALRYLRGELVAPYLPEAEAVYLEDPRPVDESITGGDD